MIEKVNKYVNNHYDQDEYNWKHNEFVTRNALKLGKIFDADLEVLEIAARFHDIDYSRGKDYHTKDSAEFAYQFLSEEGYGRAEEVRHAIMCHTSSTVKDIENPSIEGKILHDADKMWTLSPIGFARTIAHRYAKNKSFQFTLNCLRKQISNRLFFDESRRLIQEEFEICKRFLGSIERYSKDG